MRPVAEQVFQAAMALTEEDRLELVEALLAAQDAVEGPPFDAEWRAEVQRRSAEIDAGTVVPAPWAEVRDRVRRRLQGPDRG